jgi:co-chaperonin GroES (HSP10)
MNITDIEPTKGHVLVELPPKASQVGDLVIPDSDQANTAPVRGTVIRIAAAGSPFAVGETIFFRKYAVDELKFNEEGLKEVQVYIVDEREILGVVRPVEPQKEVLDAPMVRAMTKEADTKLKDSLD